ncbi:MAG: hypothetical protein ACKV19_19355 [Verrucomicrobiales bacterium]
MQGLCTLAALILTLTTGFAQRPRHTHVYTLADKPEASRRNVYEWLRQQNEGDRGTNTHVRVVQALGPNPQGGHSYVVTSETLKEPVKLDLSPTRPVFRAGASLAVTVVRTAGSHDYTSPEGQKLSLQQWREVTAAESASAGWKSYEEFIATLKAGGRESLRRTEPTNCPDCRGSGIVIRGVDCRRCTGRGSIPADRSYLVIWSRETATRRR